MLIAKLNVVDVAVLLAVALLEAEWCFATGHGVLSIISGFISDQRAEDQGRMIPHKLNAFSICSCNYRRSDSNRYTLAGGRF